MAKRKGGKSTTTAVAVSALDKIARMLGIIAVKDKTEPTDQVFLLQGAGFEPAEIASMLGVTVHNINVMNYRRRMQKAGSRSAKKH
jgi:DNA-directed RNA polymerase specialized sigma24 family protein